MLRARAILIGEDLLRPLRCSGHLTSALEKQPQPGSREGRDSGWGWSFVASPTGTSLPGAPGGEGGPPAIKGKSVGINRAIGGR